MPILDTDLEYYKSSNTDSDGGTITATAITNAVLNNLFPDVTSAEALAGAIKYRKCFVKNNHGTLTWQNVVYWRSADTTSTTEEIWIGLGTADDANGSNELSALTSNAQIELVSDGADTRNVTLVGENASGERTTETLALNGITPVLSTNTYSKLYLVYVSATDASRIVTVKQGAGGTSRGTIGASVKSAILYFNANTKADGIELGNIAPAGSQGLWLKRIVSAGTAAETDNQGTIECEGDTT